MAGKTTPYDPRATLPAQGAFVVHFRPPGRDRRRFAGRVEHLASGASAQFASLRALLAFVTALLDETREP